MAKPFTDQHIMITGAAGGIGSVLAWLLHHLGASLSLVDKGRLEPDQTTTIHARHLAREINKAGGRALGFDLDIQKHDTLETVFSESKKQLGNVHGLVHSAGLFWERNFTRLRTESLDGILGCNLRAPLLWSQFFLDQCIHQKSKGSVVLFSSSRFWQGQPNESVVCAAAAGINAFVKSVAPEFARHQCRINAVAPLAHTPNSIQSSNSRLRPSPELKAEYPARVAAFLLSSFGADFNGEIIGVVGKHIYGQRLIQSKGVILHEENLPLHDLKTIVRKALD